MARLLDDGSFVSQIGAGIMRFYNVRLIVTNEKGNVVELVDACIKM